jgi:beta-galactosidase
MYPTPQRVKEEAAKRPEMPLILCEYSHAMGNSSGGLKEYWDIFYSGTNAQGAFVWDWVDQGITLQVPAEYRMNSAKPTFLAYGGWWEDKTGVRNDNDFNNNGLVAADRTPHPGLYAIKYVYRNLHVTAGDLSDGAIKVKNWFFFTNPKDTVDGIWEVKSGSRTISGGHLPTLDIEPGEEKQFHLALPKIVPEPGAEYWLNVSFVLKQDTLWAPRGHEIAWDQMPLPVSAPAVEFIPDKSAKLDVKEVEGEATFSGRSFSLRFDRKEGVITSYRYKGATIVERGPRPDFWRAPTNNDRGAAKAMRDRIAKDPTVDLSVWREAGPRREVKEVRTERIDDTTAKVTVTAAITVTGGSYSMTYTIYGTGDVLVDTSYQPGTKKVAMMPRFGTDLVAAPGMENIAWYGRGPKETYVDRKFERIGMYKSTVDKEWVEYMRPQENGNKLDVRWVALTNAQGVGILAVGAPTLSVGAKHYTEEDIERAGYTFQMQRHPAVFLNLDGQQMGIGGIDSWSANALPMAPYRIASGQPHSFRFRLTPVDAGVAIEKKAREKF